MTKRIIRVKNYERFKNGKWESVRNYEKSIDVGTLSEQLLKDVKEGKSIKLEIDGEIVYKNIWKEHGGWREVDVDLGLSSNGSKSKAHINRIDYNVGSGINVDKGLYEYSIIYSIYDDKEKKWHSYSEHLLKRDKSEDDKIVETVIDNNPMKN